MFLRTLTIWFLLCVPALADFKGTVEKVDDGDTLWVTATRLPLADHAIAQHDGKGWHIKVRLWLADAPEIAHNSKETDQPYGQDAKKFTEQLVGAHVLIREHGFSYDRTVGEVYPDPTQKAFNLVLVTKGLAWVDPRYHPNLVYRSAEADAQAHHRGLWADPNPVPPWQWRHQ